MPSTLTRRQFLETTAGVGAALALTPLQAARAAGMFVSMNGSLITGKNVGWPDSARLASRLGYGGIDWGLGPVKTAGVEASKALFAELKLKPTIVGLPMTPGSAMFGADEAVFKQALVGLADDAALVAAVGCQKTMLVLSPSSSRPKDEQRKFVRDRVAAVSEVIQKSNLRLGLEFLGPLCMRMGSCRGAPANPPTPFIWTLPETVELAKDCGPNIGAVLDVWHWHHSNGTTADILAAGNSRIVHVHVSDAKQTPVEDVRDNQRLMPGEGIIDLIGFFQALKKIGYEDGVSPEPLGRITPEMTAEDGAKLGLETTLAVMKKAGVV